MVGQVDWLVYGWVCRWVAIVGRMVWLVCQCVYVGGYSRPGGLVGMSVCVGAWLW